MFLFEPERTQFDLNWRMFGISVRVHPMFWVVAILFGRPNLDDPKWLSFLLIWVGCFFVSILIHELGHVIVGRIFGADGNIVLYSFGGLAIGSSTQEKRWQRNLVYFAGPLAGFLLAGVIVVVVLLLLPKDLPQYVVKSPLDYLRIVERNMLVAGWHVFGVMAVHDLLWMNIWWGLLNLLPIWPLDGGRISRETAEWLDPRRGTRIALVISGGLAATLAINSLMANLGRAFIPYIPAGGLYYALFFGMLAAHSFMTLQAENTRERWRGDDSTSWDRYDDDEDRDRDRWRR